MLSEIITIVAALLIYDAIKLIISGMSWRNSDTCKDPQEEYDKYIRS